MRRNKIYFSCFLGFLLLIIPGCGKDRDERLAEADRKLSEAEALIRKSDFTGAEILLRGAFDINLGLKRDSVQGEILLMIAGCHRWNGDYDSIPATLNRAILHYREAGAQRGVRKGLKQLGRFYLRLGDYRKSMTYASEAAASAKVLQDTTDLIEALSISAAAARSLNRFDQAFAYAREMAGIDSIRYKSEYRTEIYESMTNMLFASGKSGDIRRIISNLENDNDAGSLLRVYTRWGELYYRAGKPDSALRLFAQGLIYVDNRTEMSLRIRLLSALGSVAYRTRHYDMARMYFLDALSAARENGILSLRRALEGILIACDWKYSDPNLKQYKKEFMDRASTLSAASASEGSTYGEMIGLALSVRLSEEGKDSSDILQLHERLHALSNSSFSVDETENTEVQILQSFLDGEMYSCNTGLLEFSVLNDDHNRLFGLIEEENLRAINRFFSRVTITTGNDALNNALASYQNEYRVMDLLLNDISEESAKGKTGSRERVNFLLDKYREKAGLLKTVAQDIRKENQNFGYIYNPIPQSLVAIRESLGEDDIVTQYFRIRDTLYFMVISKDTSHIVKGTRSAARVERFVNEYNRLMGDHWSSGNQARGQSTASAFRIDELSGLLGEALAEPLRPYLDGVKHLYIVPPPEYGMLPFHTLRLGNNYISESYIVHYLPAASVLLMSGRETGDLINVTAVGHAGTTNWDIEYELRDIRSFFEDAVMIFGPEATLSVLENTACDVLHLGAEFRLDTNYPDNTTCLLAGSRSLSAQEYTPVGRMLKIPSPQVLVLSNISSESGVLRGCVPLLFLANGTPAVITTMWRGDRRSNRAFGEGFYTALKEGIRADEAYYKAVGELIGQAEFTKPQQWGMYYYFGKK